MENAPPGKASGCCPWAQDPSTSRKKTWPKKGREGNTFWHLRTSKPKKKKNKTHQKTFGLDLILAIFWPYLAVNDGLGAADSPKGLRGWRKEERPAGMRRAGGPGGTGVCFTALQNLDTSG